jgi:hypothetical protein
MGIVVSVFIALGRCEISVVGIFRLGTKLVTNVPLYLLQRTTEHTSKILKFVTSCKSPCIYTMHTGTRSGTNDVYMKLLAVEQFSKELTNQITRKFLLLVFY